MQQASIIIVNFSPSQQTTCGMPPGCMYIVYEKVAQLCKYFAAVAICHGYPLIVRNEITSIEEQGNLRYLIDQAITQVDLSCCTFFTIFLVLWAWVETCGKSCTITKKRCQCHRQSQH